MNVLNEKLNYANFRQLIKLAFGAAVFILFFGIATTRAEINISNTPLLVTQAVPSLVMLNVSNDNQLYFQAYPDYADLTGDGAANTTYTHSFDYYGYFDAYKCYSYSGGVFAPAAITSTKYCAGSQWSGNFLNWLTMARIDVVRKILYGGYRSTDSASQTILERTYLPNDAHSWVRFYDGSDIDQLTPFSLSTETISTSSSEIAIPTGDRNNSSSRRTFATSWTSNNQVQIGDQIVIEDQSDPANKRMYGVVIAKSGSNIEIQITASTGAGQTGSAWNLTNSSRRGVSFCNTTVSSTTQSQNVTDPPLLRVAQGNYSLWTANERWQCRWSNEKNRTGHDEMRVGGFNFSNGNVYSASGLFANSDNPVRNQVGLGLGDYTVRVEVCTSNLIGQENCKQYPAGNYKPIGLLQSYADEGNIHFGLLTGSYTNNLSGGVLRKNISSFDNELTLATGQFVTPSAGGSIVRSLDVLRLYGYNHSTGVYSGAGDNCDVGVTKSQITSGGRCRNWGNPQAEMFLESLRYFAGKSPTSAFAVSGSDQLTGLISDSWQDPLSQNNWCAVSSIINFNASVSSFDGNQLSGFSNIGTGSIDTWTNKVGTGEGLDSQSRFYGGSNALCTAKTISSLSGVTGLCPEAPNQDGTFHIAGLAHYAYTESIRSDLKNNDDETADIQIKTYGVTLAPAVPRINIPKPGETATTVTILPACENKGDGGLRCALSDFRIIEQDIAAGTGKFFIQWDVHEWGSDFDMDINGTLSYQITDNNITVTTQTWAQSSSRQTGFGYIISGTTQDGYHAHSGINNYDYTDPTGVLGCNNCAVNAASTSHTYSLGGTVAQLLREPAFYAAKWGGFNKHESVEFPDDVASWDRDGDGMPDNYFFAIDPARLAESMSTIFEIISDQRAVAAAAVSSPFLSDETLIFTAGFNSEDWSGELKAHRVQDYKTSYAGCEAGSKLQFKVNRNLFTTKIDYIPGDTTQHTTEGVILDFGQLSASQQTALNASDDLGAERISWLENTSTYSSFRDLEGKVLGDIVSSNPALVRQRYQGFSRLIDAPSFRNSPSVIYVGSNGGMLHAFKADCDNNDCSKINVSCGGLFDELFAFVPGELLSETKDSTTAPINALMEIDYIENGKRFFVDGTPTIEEVYIDNEWKRVLVGTMGAGGRSVFALDVTEPQSFSAAKVLWEFSDPDLGYGVHEAKIARLQDEKWVAIFGNGYNSDQHRAMLFIVNLSTGELITKIDTETGDSANPNGLAIPAWTDWPNADIKARSIYAGDLLGNLWRFNVTHNNASQWDATKIFAAVNDGDQTQPITSAPYVGAISKEDGSEALIVSFGTGSYFRTSDQDLPNASIQTLYGIVDDANGTIDRNDLVEQTIVLQQVKNFVNDGVENNFNIRVLSDNAVDLSAKNGWYVDLDIADGERVVNGPERQSVTRIRFSTLIPNPDNDPCAPSASGNFMDLDLLTGGRTTNSVFDLDGSGTFDEDDMIEVNGELVAVSGIEFGTGERIRVVSTIDASIGRAVTGGGEISDFGIDLEGKQGRQSWQQLR